LKVGQSPPFSAKCMKKWLMICRTPTQFSGLLIGKDTTTATTTTTTTTNTTATTNFSELFLLSNYL